MKNIFKIFIAAVIVLFYSACHKVDDLPLYGNGSAVVLSTSSSVIAAAPADSNNTIVTFSWTSPQYAQDSSLYKFVVEIDSAGRNFTKEVTKTVTGVLSASMTAKELNNILLGFGFAFNTQYTVDVRVTSSYGNNNEQYKSNTIQLQVTPYKVPPKIIPPAHLYIVGNATAGGWNNPVPVPSQELALVDETTFMGVFDMSGGNQYLLLPVNGDWSHKYAVGDNQPAEGGDFGYDAANNFTGPATGGMYLIVVDFQHGKYSLTPYTGPQLPTDLFMVGDATTGGWNNPVPVPDQQFTRLNSVQFELTLPISAGHQYLFLPVNGSWSNKYAVADNSIPGLDAGGYFGYNFGANFPGPALAGNYKIELNFALHDPAAPTAATAKFKTTKL
ncbi:MAG: SusE domain-containing protein [Ferruginibacter sp.]